jgi:FtsP/CotA-like multicopper oxidase with cupredoxin domain
MGIWPPPDRELSRRELLRLLGAGVSIGMLSSCGTAPSLAPTQSQSRPSVPTASSTGKIHPYTLEAAPIQVTFGKQQVSTWAYNGMVPGLQLRVREGDTLQVTVHNRLPQDTTVHWHGLPIVNKMDGIPNVTQAPIRPGQSFVYQFVVPTAGTYLYHTHTGLQLDRGLYGSLIVEASHETMTYDQEFVLVLDDWLDGIPGTPEDQMRQLQESGNRMGGMRGMGRGSGSTQEIAPDVIYPLYLINGKPSSDPFLMTVKPGQRLRLRLGNPSSATIYHVALQGHHLTVTHADGQPVEPVEVDALRIGMGERYDALVTIQGTGVWQLAARVEGTQRLVRAVVRTQGTTTALPPRRLPASGTLWESLTLWPAQSGSQSCRSSNERATGYHTARATERRYGPLCVDDQWADL